MTKAKKKTPKVLALPKFRATDVRDEIARLAREQSIDVIILDHAVDRQDQRGVTSRQILNVLKNGDQIGTVDWCTERENSWRCKMSRVTAGSKVTVVAKLVERKEDT
jgi:hypothetical protein